MGLIKANIASYKLAKSTAQFSKASGRSTVKSAMSGFKSNQAIANAVHTKGIARASKANISGSTLRNAARTARAGASRTTAGKALRKAHPSTHKFTSQHNFFHGS